RDIDDPHSIDFRTPKDETLEGRRLEERADFAPIQAPGTSPDVLLSPEGKTHERIGRQLGVRLLEDVARQWRQEVHLVHHIRIWLLPPHEDALQVGGSNLLEVLEPAGGADA